MEQNAVKEAHKPARATKAAGGCSDKLACKNTQEEAVRNTKGQFMPGQSGNPSGRPTGATCHALRLAREAAEQVALPLLIEAAKGGDMDACKTLLAYGLPRQKPVSIPAPVPIEGETLAERMKTLLALVAAGEVASDVAGDVAGVIATAARVEETEELRSEVAGLKRVLEIRWQS